MLAHVGAQVLSTTEKEFRVKYQLLVIDSALPRTVMMFLFPMVQHVRYPDHRTASGSG